MSSLGRGRATSTVAREPAAKVGGVAWAVIATAVAKGRACFGTRALATLEVALALLQAQAATTARAAMMATSSTAGCRGSELRDSPLELLVIDVQVGGVQQRRACAQHECASMCEGEVVSLSKQQRSLQQS